ncbi:MAG: transcriptional regulator NrdR [Sphingomonadaceae bacterium]
MRCPFCHHEDSQVKDSRPTEDGAAIRRRRQCPGCGARFTTFERVQLRDLVVVKKSGKKEAFEREKLARSVIIACRKRDIDADSIERLVSSVQRQMEASGENEIEADRIGELVMQGLARLDPVAYVRFASVYKDFREAQDFETFVGGLSEGLVREKGAQSEKAASDG